MNMRHATGFDAELVDLTNGGHDRVMAVRNQLLDMAHKDPQLTQVRANGLEDEPQYLFDVDWEKASWSIPVAAMLVVPLGIIGAIIATLARGLDNDVFFQVGLLTTVGLSAKNAILMTSPAFILGVLPLAISQGAGSGGQNAIGTGVIGGMLSATVLAIFFVPLFFVATLELFGSQSARQESQRAEQSGHEAGASG
jgi:multidrug efflux pump subunit AcrB